MAAGHFRSGHEVAMRAKVPDSWSRSCAATNGRSPSPPAFTGQGRSPSPTGDEFGQRPLRRLLSIVKDQEGLWAQLVMSSRALEGQLQALRAEHEVLKLEGQVLRRCLDRAGVLSAHELEQELRHCGNGALVDASAAASNLAREVSQDSLVMAGRSSLDALTEVEQMLRHHIPTNLGSGRRSPPPPINVELSGGAPTPPPRELPNRPQSRSKIPPTARTASRGRSLAQRGSAQPFREEQGSPRRPVIMGGGGGGGARRQVSPANLPNNSSTGSLRPASEDGVGAVGSTEGVAANLDEALRPVLVQGSTAFERQQAMRGLQQYLKVRPDPLSSWTGPGGVLGVVVKAGRPDVAQILLRARANVNERDPKGVSPLHISVFDGHAELCKVLLAARADVEASDRHGQTPLFFAPNRDMCKILVERRADIGVLNRKGQTALHLAGRAGFHEVLTWLSARANKQLVELRDHHGNSACMYAQQAAAAVVASSKNSGMSPAVSPVAQIRPTIQAATEQLPCTSSLLEDQTDPKGGADKASSAEVYQLYEEPEQYNMSVSDEQGVEVLSRSAAGAAVLEAAAQVASAAVATAAAAATAAAEVTELQAVPTSHWSPAAAVEETEILSVVLPAPAKGEGASAPVLLEDMIDECW
eukprot:TRINITY_DN73334_c0_g1_i1.p1 TRINITY_DN73334_c0_g1~~TRINITY_DN73334_c0_g1_i1.p1  ORF type:complete len:658 (+),score=118.07 TRINITY_DN73334_c0_g1_i1:48-1976(+)